MLKGATYFWYFPPRAFGAFCLFMLFGSLSEICVADQFAKQGRDLWANIQLLLPRKASKDDEGNDGDKDNPLYATSERSKCFAAHHLHKLLLQQPCKVGHYYSSQTVIVSAATCPSACPHSWWHFTPRWRSHSQVKILVSKNQGSCMRARHGHIYRMLHFKKKPAPIQGFFWGTLRHKDDTFKGEQIYYGIKSARVRAYFSYEKCHLQFADIFTPRATSSTREGDITKRGQKPLSETLLLTNLLIFKEDSAAFAAMDQCSQPSGTPSASCMAKF